MKLHSYKRISSLRSLFLGVVTAKLGMKAPAACGKAHDVEIRPWVEDTLKRIPTEKDITMLLPENWQPVTVK